MLYNLLLSKTNMTQKIISGNRGRRYFQKFGKSMNAIVCFCVIPFVHNFRHFYWFIEFHLHVHTCICFNFKRAQVLIKRLLTTWSRVTKCQTVSVSGPLVRCKSAVNFRFFKLICWWMVLIVFLSEWSCHDKVNFVHRNWVISAYFGFGWHVWNYIFKTILRRIL